MRAPEFWDARPGLLSLLLSPLGHAWTAGGALRRACARPYHAGVPVICVGNLVAGGSGKTPVVLSLAAVAHRLGLEAHVVSRGYGGDLAGPVRVDPHVHDAAAVGDEALLLAVRAACWVARDRAAGLRAAEQAGAGLILLDDGFQNPTVHKDCALVVIDAGYGFGNGCVIPAGPLREPIASGLGRADAIVLIGDDPAPRAVTAAAKPVYRAGVVAAADASLNGERVVAFAGIGRPAKFFATLRSIGAAVIEEHAFADHHRFSDSEIARLRAAAERTGARLVTTAKDHIRLPPGLRRGIDVLEVEIDWRDKAAIAHLVADVAGRAITTDDRRSARG